MARTYIKDLLTGQRIEGQTFLMLDTELRTSANGSMYINAQIADRTGKIPGKLWQASQQLYDQLPAEGYVALHGRIETYKNSLQFIIEAVKPLSDQQQAAIDPTEFLPRSEKDIEQMYKQTLKILRTVKNNHLLMLIKQFVSDEHLMERFKAAPAAITLHHAYIGGLLEHTLNLLEMAQLIGPRYKDINMDLMLTGTFLHDIGKLEELSWDVGFKYTDKGQLVGHLALAVIWTHQRAQIVEHQMDQPFPQELLHVLEHMILSHHGEYQYGSPKLPATAEAIALHYLDNLDAKMDLIRQKFEASTQSDSNWTPYIRSLERRLFKPQDPSLLNNDNQEPGQ